MSVSSAPKVDTTEHRPGASSASDKARPTRAGKTRTPTQTHTETHTHIQVDTESHNGHDIHNGELMIAALEEDQDAVVTALGVTNLRPAVSVVGTRKSRKASVTVSPTAVAAASADTTVAVAKPSADSDENKRDKESSTKKSPAVLTKYEVVIYCALLYGSVLVMCVGWSSYLVLSNVTS